MTGDKIPTTDVCALLLRQVELEDELKAANKLIVAIHDAIGVEPGTDLHLAVYTLVAGMGEALDKIERLERERIAPIGDRPGNRDQILHFLATEEALACL